MHSAIQTLTKTLHHHPSALTRPWPGPPIHVLDAQVVYARRESHACSIRVIVYRVPCKSPRQTQHTHSWGQPMSHGWQAQRAVSLLDSQDLRNSSPRDKDTNANTLATLTLGTGEYLRMHMDIVPSRAA